MTGQCNHLRCTCPSPKEIGAFEEKLIGKADVSDPGKMETCGLVAVSTWLLAYKQAIMTQT